MTDFLHLQDNPTPVQPAQVGVESGSGSAEEKNEKNPVAESVMEPVSDSVSREGGGLASNAQAVSRATESVNVSAPIKRDFSRIRKTSDEEDEEEEKVRHVIRKESPLLVHYYQSVFLLLIMLFVASGYFVLSPLIATFKQVNLEVSSTLVQKEGAEAYLASLNRSIRAAETISPESMKRIDEALPKEVNIPVLMKTFLLLAKNNGVKMDSIQFSSEQASSESTAYGGYSLASVRASASITAPGYLVMRRYLEDLQKNIRLLDVESIKVDGNQDTGEMSYTLELKTYFLQKRAGAPSSGGMVPGGVRAPSAPVNLNDI